MSDYQFSTKHLDAKWAEIRVVMPNSGLPPLELSGPEARKKLVKWLLASANGLVQSVGMDMNKIFYDVMMIIDQSIDIEQVNRAAVLEYIRERNGFLAPRYVEENPPKDLSPTEARLMVQQLISEGAVILNDRLKLEIQT